MLKDKIEEKIYLKKFAKVKKIIKKWELNLLGKKT
jgi:hypothetical protein